MEQVNDEGGQQDEMEPVEEMEEDSEVKEDEEMEEDVPEPAESNPKSSGDEDEAGILDPDSEEEGEEDEEEVEENREKELLEDDEEVGREEKVNEVETKEDRIGEEVISFEQIEDHSDPISLNQNPNLSNLDINSPKDYLESDDDVFNENTKAQAEASMTAKSTTGSSTTVTKSITGSTESHLAEALTKTPPSKTDDIEMKDEERSEIEEKHEEVEEKQEEKKEVMERGRGGMKEKADRRSSSSGAVQWAATDKRYREVKADNLPENIMKTHAP